MNESILVKIAREIKTLLKNQFNQKFSDLSRLLIKNIMKDTIKPDWNNASDESEVWA